MRENLINYGQWLISYHCYEYMYSELYSEFQEDVLFKDLLFEGVNISVAKTYEFQKKFLDENPERIVELKEKVGLDAKIAIEYKEVFEMIGE